MDQPRTMSPSRERSRSEEHELARVGEGPRGRSGRGGTNEVMAREWSERRRAPGGARGRNMGAGGEGGAQAAG